MTLRWIHWRRLPQIDFDHFALRPQKRGCLLGTARGVGWGGGGGGTKEWRLDRGYRPKKTGDRRQNNGSVKAVSPRHCAAISALRNCCFNRRAGQSHKDNVRCTAVEEQPEAKEVQLSQPSSTSLLVISSGLTWGLSSTSLLLISPGTLIPRIQWQPLLTNATDRVQHGRWRWNLGPSLVTVVRLLQFWPGQSVKLTQ